MLVLTRQLSQEVIIDTPGGERVIVRVLRIDRGGARLGISAPASVKIRRAELAATDEVRPGGAALSSNDKRDANGNSVNAKTGYFRPVADESTPPANSAPVS